MGEPNGFSWSLHRLQKPPRPYAIVATSSDSIVVLAVMNDLMTLNIDHLMVCCNNEHCIRHREHGMVYTTCRTCINHPRATFCLFRQSAGRRHPWEDHSEWQKMNIWQFLSWFTSQPAPSVNTAKMFVDDSALTHHMSNSDMLWAFDSIKMYFCQLWEIGTHGWWLVTFLAPCNWETCSIKRWVIAGS